jgi:two-component system nitrogen regulation response regulator GlnG
VITETSNEEGQLKKEHDTVIEEDLKVGIIGNAAAMQEVYKMIGQVAPTDVTVLITGESGTGKELIARAIHKNSFRAGHSFVAVNCSAIPENLIESELFGHEKGSFTGASQQRKGYFEQCDRGTIFLDEIGDMPLTAQTKILRALQEGEIQRVGGTEIIKVDVRILAATNKSIESMVKKNTFREDLYYRLNVVRILMPALRQRKQDIPLLINFMLQNLTKKNQAVANTIAKEALDLLVEYNWPGNVRELENIVHRSAVLAQGNTILAKDLPSEINQAEYSDITASTKEKGENEAVDFHDLYNELCQISDNQDILSRVEAELIKEAIGASKGVLAKAAKILGMTTNTLKKRIEKYQIQ